MPALVGPPKPGPTHRFPRSLDTAARGIRVLVVASLAIALLAGAASAAGTNRTLDPLAISTPSPL
ncbi:MAG TPA: hypothetical protein VI792_10445, partial [Candidatus Eisenbacteria bacterium]